MPTSPNLKALEPLSEQDSNKVATYNAAINDLDYAESGMLVLDVGGGAGTTDLTRVQAVNKVIKFIGTLTGNRTIRFPIALGTGRAFTIWNATTGAFTLTLKTTVGGTGLVVTQTKKVNIFHDGTEVYASSAEV